MPKTGRRWDDRKGHGVVDQKNADHQRQQAEGGQVDAEGSCHLGNGAAAGGVWLYDGIVWQDGFNLRNGLGAVFRQDQVDLVNGGCPVGEFLRGGNICQNDAVECPAAEAVLRGDQANNLHGFGLPVNLQGQFAACFYAKLAGQVCGEQHGIWRGQKFGQGFK